MSESISLLERIDGDLKQAMRDRDEVAKLTLRSVKTAVTEAGKRGDGAAEDDEAVMVILQQEAKRRRDAASEYERVGRADRVEQENAELAILARYLPKQMDDDQLEAIVREVIVEVGATSMRDMGRVMPAVMSRVDGRADGKRVNLVVRKLLA